MAKPFYLSLTIISSGSISIFSLSVTFLYFISEFFQQHNDTAHIPESLERVEKSRRSRVNVAFTAHLPHPATLRPSVLSVVDTFTVVSTYVFVLYFFFSSSLIVCLNGNYKRRWLSLVEMIFP